MTEEAGFGSIKSTQQIQKEILAKAKELDIPVNKDNLTVSRGRDMLTVEAHYQIELDFFGGAYKYVWKFDPVINQWTWMGGGSQASSFNRGEMLANGVDFGDRGSGVNQHAVRGDQIGK